MAAAPWLAFSVDVLISLLPQLPPPQQELVLTPQLRFIQRAAICHTAMVLRRARFEGSFH